jgi:hypothetical protein
VTCKRCRVPMQQEKHQHLCHGNRKWRCPQCKRARMQKPKKGRKSKNAN